MDPDGLARWREKLIADRDGLVIEAARRWLGPLKTPYNKHGLVSRLELYLTRPEIRCRMAALMDETDRLVAALLRCRGPLPEAYLEQLLVAGGAAPAAAAARLRDLKARMVVCAYDEGKARLAELSPFLSDLVAPLRLAPAAAEGAPALGVDPLLGFCALVSACAQAKPAFKSRTSLSKTAQAIAEGAAPFLADEALFSAYLGALTKAGVFAEDETGRPALFPRGFLELAERLGRGFVPWLAAGAAELEKTGRELGALALSLFWDRLTETAVLPRREALFLIADAALEATAALGRSVKPEDAALPAALLGACARLGLASELADGRWALAPPLRYGEGSSPSMTASSSHEIRLSAKAGVAVRAWSCVVARFEEGGRLWGLRLDRPAMTAAMAWGFKADDLVARLERESGGRLPQGLRFSLDSWAEEARGVALRQGVILALDAHRAAVLEASPAYAGLVRERLRDGLYLLSCGGLREAERALAELGMALDLRASYADEPGLSEAEGLTAYAGILASAETAGEKPGPSARVEGGQKAPAGDDMAARDDIVATLLRALGKLSIPEEKRSALADRVRAGYVLDEIQLAEGEWPSDGQAVGGLDYPAKLRLVERAIREGMALELAVSGKGLAESIRAWPIRLYKTAEGMELELADAPRAPRRIALRHLVRARLVNTDLYGA